MPTGVGLFLSPLGVSVTLFSEGGSGDGSADILVSVGVGMFRVDVSYPDVSAAGLKHPLSTELLLTEE